MLKFLMLKCWNHSTTTRNHAICYKTLEDISWHLPLKNSKNDKFSKSLKKIEKISIKLCVLAICCSNVATREGGGGGGGGWRAPGANGEGGGQQ